MFASILRPRADGRRASASASRLDSSSPLLAPRVRRGYRDEEQESVARQRSDVYEADDDEGEGEDEDGDNDDDGSDNGEDEDGPESTNLLPIFSAPHLGKYTIFTVLPELVQLYHV